MRTHSSAFSNEMKMYKKTVFLIASSVLVCSAGCGGSDNRAEVSGEIRVAGQPPVNGSIAFHPTEGNSGPTAGARVTDGKYHIDRAKGVVPGKNLVKIRGIEKTGDTTVRYSQAVDEHVQILPPHFNVESTLVRDVQPGSNVIDFELELDE